MTMSLQSLTGSTKLKPDTSYKNLGKSSTKSKSSKKNLLQGQQQMVTGNNPYLLEINK